MVLAEVANYINTLGRFLGCRDLDELSGACLARRFGINRADVGVLFGGSIVHGGDVFARMMRGNLARRYMIVGGAGHTTESLRGQFKAVCPEMEVEGRSEAECFAGYLRLKYGLTADYLETRSTNCGNNITFCLDLLRKNGVALSSIIFVQDASMQRRMDAGFRKYLPGDVQLINYAAYEAEAVVKDGTLQFAEDILGMWDMNRYISLLLGEIPRLRDDAQGYGPNGKGFIAHVDIPLEAEDAFCCLSQVYAELVRKADERFARPI